MNNDMICKIIFIRQGRPTVFDRVFFPPQAIINCTITPSMTFTRTSQKFGQWADSRANTVYGLGFATEQQLHQVKISNFLLDDGPLSINNSAF